MFKSLRICFKRFYSTSDTRLLRFNVPKGYIQPEPAPEDDIIISMSSGVDSSVSALMYSKKYSHVRGIFMANWSSSADGHVGAACNRDDGSKGMNSSCTVDSDWKEVRQTCEQLSIPCERVNFEKEYWLDVFDPMLEMYQQGLTPNPDVGCNKYIKFGAMINHLTRYYSKHANPNKKWWLVTGHYTKLLQEEKTGEFHMFRADYKPKDQSYYLSQVPENVLNHILLPIGHYKKPEVRQIASDYKLVTRDKPDSQGLCFVAPQQKFSDFLDEYLELNPGNIVDRTGKIWGKHKGLWHGTIGQRCGISMPQGDPKYKGVWMICDKDIEHNELVIARKDDREAFNRNRIHVTNWQWMNKSLNMATVCKFTELNAQLRSLQKPTPVSTISEDKNGTINVQLGHTVFGVAPGQDLVLYQGDRVLGCGMIEKAL